MEILRDKIAMGAGIYDSDGEDLTEIIGEGTRAQQRACGSNKRYCKYTGKCYKTEKGKARFCKPPVKKSGSKTSKKVKKPKTSKSQKDAKPRKRSTYQEFLSRYAKEERNAGRAFNMADAAALWRECK
jgi:hypothetical protein